MRLAVARRFDVDVERAPVGVDLDVAGPDHLPRKGAARDGEMDDLPR